ncbi:MAG: nitrophenyl compound nitroreductase subunit ArsF family protein [Candidatus Methanofastidiosia archaeon]
MIFKQFSKKFTIFVIVLVLMATSVSMCIVSSNDTKPPPSVDPSIKRIDIAYFHETKRCEACYNIEKWSYETIFLYFEDELKSGKITYASYNLDEKSTDDVSKIYNSCYTSLYLNVIYAGKQHIEEVKKSWEYSDDKDVFLNYFRDLLDEKIALLG